MGSLTFRWLFMREQEQSCQHGASYLQMAFYARTFAKLTSNESSSQLGTAIVNGCAHCVFFSGT